MKSRELSALRKEIGKADADILEALARRADISKEIGLTKARKGASVRDPTREKIVKTEFREAAQRLGLSKSLANDIAILLISDSVRIQRKKTALPFRNKKVLVVGGAGKMGEWACRFFANRGAEVSVWDPLKPSADYENVKDPEPAAHSANFIVLAGPLGRSSSDLRKVTDAHPQGIVFDLCSVKSELAPQLMKACRDGLKVASVHPMFGPRAASPTGRNVIVCDCGSRQATQTVVKLFSSAGAKVSEVGLEKHDELMAYVLGLSHLCTLLFVRTVVVSRKSLVELSDVKGPSFARLVKMARELSRESKRVYHDIQSLNPHTKRMISAMEGALKELERASLAKDPAAFGKIMESSKRALEVT